MKRDLRLVIFIALVARFAGCTGDSGETSPSVEKCTVLRDHLVELRLQAAAGVDVSAHREHLRSALGEDFIERCTKTMTTREVDCAILAGHADEATACTRQRAR